VFGIRVKEDKVELGGGFWFVGNEYCYLQWGESSDAIVGVDMVNFE